MKKAAHTTSTTPRALKNTARNTVVPLTPELELVLAASEASPERPEEPADEEGGRAGEGGIKTEKRMRQYEANQIEW